MLKILNLLPRIPTPAVDGGAIAVYYNLHYLKRSGAEVVIASFESNRHPQDQSLTASEFELYSVPGNFREYSSLTALGNIFDSRPYNLALRFDQDSFRSLLYQVREKHSTFDIVQCDWIYMAPYVTLIRKLWPDARLVLRQHNAEHVIFSRMAAHEPSIVQRWFLRYQAGKMKSYEASNMRNFDLVIALTEVDRTLFRELTPSEPPRMTTIPVGVDLNRFDRSQEAPREKMFLILGSMGWAPYVQALLWFLHHIWQDFHDQNPDYRLVIIGSNPPPEVKAFDGHFAVEVPGFVDDVLPYLHESSAMIVPLKSGSGMRVKIIEAMASGLPIVTTSVGCEGIPIAHEEHCLIADTVEKFSEAMQRIVDEPEFAERMARKAFEVAEKGFSWEVIARRTLEAYESIMKN